MNYRIETVGEGDDAKPTAAPTCSGVRRRENVIAFRRVEAAACPAASSPSSADGLDAFIPVGQAIAAVVLRLRYGFPRINCDRPSTWEEEAGPDGLS